MDNRASSEIFKAWDLDPYGYIHIPVKLDVGVERLQAKLPSIKEGRTKTFKSQLDKIDAQIIALDETVKLGSNADSINNQVKILSQKWQLIKIKETDDIFLPLTSQFKNAKK